MTKQEELEYLQKLEKVTVQRTGFLVFYRVSETEIGAYECKDLLKLKESLDRSHPEYKLIYAEPYHSIARARSVTEALRVAREYRLKCQTIEAA